MKTIITLAIATILAATVTWADGGNANHPKGGASGLMKAPAVRTETPAAAPMNCPKCKSDFVKVTTPAPKGNAPVTSIVERHACADCGTKRVSTGTGKARVETVVHTCGGCKM